MKLIKGVIIIILFMSPFSIFGQNIKAALYGGFNVTQIEGDALAGFYKLGINGGPAAIIPFSDKFSGSIELTFSQKGSRPAPTYEGLQDFRKYRLDYAEVPILFNYHDKEDINFGIGFAIGTLINYKEFDISGEVNVDEPPFKKRDFSIVANGVYMISEHWGVNLRWSYSLTPIRYWPAVSNFRNKGAYNNVVTIRGLYIF